MHMCAHVCSGVLTHTCLCEDQRLILGFPLFLLYFCETGSLIQLRLELLTSERLGLNVSLKPFLPSTVTDVPPAWLWLELTSSCWDAPADEVLVCWTISPEFTPRPVPGEVFLDVLSVSNGSLCHQHWNLNSHSHGRLTWLHSELVPSPQLVLDLNCHTAFQSSCQFLSVCRTWVCWTFVAVINAGTVGFGSWFVHRLTRFPPWLAPLLWPWGEAGLLGEGNMETGWMSEGRYAFLLSLWDVQIKCFPSFFTLFQAKNEDSFLQGSNGYISSGIHGPLFRAAAFLHWTPLLWAL